MAVNGTSRARRRHAGGLSLVEAIISMAIVSIMLVMVLNTLGSLAGSRYIQSIQCRAPALARRLMSEIVQCHYEEPDGSPLFGPESPETSSTRAGYDDVDDYNGWSTSPPQMKDGTVMSDIAGWGRGVTVQYVDPGDVNSTTGTDGGLKRITVTVTDPRGAQTTLVALRASGSVYDLRPQTETTYVSWAGVQLQMGSDGQGRIVSGANILNQVPAEE